MISYPASSDPERTPAQQSPEQHTPAQQSPSLPSQNSGTHAEQLLHYRHILSEYMTQAREYAHALRSSYTNEVYELWHEHITSSSARDEESIESGNLKLGELESLTRKWVRLMRESRDMLHHESMIAAARAALETKPLPE